MKKFVAALTLVSLATPLVATAASASTAKSSCASVTKKLVVSDGFTQATGPKVTKYDYKHPKKNAANALGTTIDFGAKALIVGCVSPRDLVHLSKQAGKKTMSATAYMKYMVAQSGGAMTKTKWVPFLTTSTLATERKMDLVRSQRLAAFASTPG
jgi:hypothetical protein